MNARGVLSALGSRAAKPVTLDPELPEVLRLPPYGAGWYADPVRRDGFRFFDGINWTPTVINADVDPEAERA